MNTCANCGRPVIRIQGDDHFDPKVWYHEATAMVICSPWHSRFDANNEARPAHV